MKRFRLLLGLVAPVGLAVALVACARSNGAAPRARLGAPALTAAGPLTVLVTGTAWGNLEPCG